MRRREFLKQTTATAAALSAGPILLGMTDKAESKTPTVGKGEHTYECHHNWGELPSSLEWQTTNAIEPSRRLI